MRHARLTGLALTLTLAALPVSAAEEKTAAEKPSPEFDRLKALAGDWEGTAKAAGSDKAMTTVATYRVVSNGSVVMLVTDAGTSHEMVTMFHRDDGAILATHYCAAMNQPRMRLALPASAPDRLQFDFQDGTNLGAHPGRMQRLVVTISDRDHHRQEWTYRGEGHETAMAMELRRKAK